LAFILSVFRTKIIEDSFIQSFINVTTANKDILHL